NRPMRSRTSGAAVALIALAVVSCLAVQPAGGQGGGAPGGGDLLAALRGGGVVLYFRHADTDHRQNDARMRRLDDCAGQRDLTERGREHARAIGLAIRELSIPIGPVLASPLCRTVETAMLAFGAAERSLAAREAGPAPPGSPDRFTALRALLSTVPPAGTNAVV